MTKQEKTALIATLANFFLTAVKFFLAFLTGSVALLAEAYHSFVDIVTSLSVFFALHLDASDKRRVEEYDKNEQTRFAEGAKLRIFRRMGWDGKAAIGIGMLLIVIAIGIFLKILVFNSVSLKYPIISTVVLACLAVFSYLVFRFETHVGSETGSQALLADGQHAKSDMLVTLLVIATLLGDWVGIRFDRAAAFFIAIYIFTNGITVMTKSVRAYFLTRKGEYDDKTIVLEDSLVIFLTNLTGHLKRLTARLICLVPGLGGEIKKAVFRLSVAMTVVLLAVYLFSGTYIVSVSEQAVVERFGRPLNNAESIGPGIHFCLPWPVDKVRKVDTLSIKRVSAGYTGVRQDAEFILWTNIHYIEEHSFLTGDNSFLDSAVNIHYRINRLQDFLYCNSEPSILFIQITYNKLLEIFSNRGFFETVTSDRDELEMALQKDIQGSADMHKLGIEIVSVCFRDLHPPAEIAPIYEDVVSAQEDYETSIENAKGYSMDLIPRARSEAKQTVLKGEAYKEKTEVESRSKAEAFNLQRKVYEKYPSITESRMVLQTLEESLGNVEKYIVYPGDEEKASLWFSLQPDKSFINNWTFQSGGNK